MEDREIYLVTFFSVLSAWMIVFAFVFLNYDRLFTNKRLKRIDQSYPIVFGSILSFWTLGWIYLASKNGWKMERIDIYLVTFISVIMVWMIVGVYLALSYDRLFGKKKKSRST